MNAEDLPNETIKTYFECRLLENFTLKEAFEKYDFEQLRVIYYCMNKPVFVPVGVIPDMGQGIPTRTEEIALTYYRKGNLYSDKIEAFREENNEYCFIETYKIETDIL